MLQRTLGAPAQEESERKKGIKSTQSFSNDVIFKQIEEQQKIQQQAQQRPPLSQDSVTILQRLKPDDDVSNKFQMLGLSIGGAVENTALSSPFHATQAPPATSNHQPATSPLAALPPPLSQQNETLLKELQQLQLQHYTQSAFFHAHAHGPSAYAPRLPQGVDLLMNGFPPTGMNVHQFVPSQQVHGQTGMLGHHPNGFGLHLPMPNPTTLPLTYQNSAQSAHFQQLLQAQTAALQSQKASSVKQAMKASLLAKK